MRTRRFRLSGDIPAQTRRFRLPKSSAPFLQLTPVEQPARRTLQRASEHEPYRYPAKAKEPVRQRAQVNTQTYIVKAPVAARTDRRRVVALLASESWMPGPLGPLRLRISRDSVDVTRVERGNLPAALDHNTDRPFGRVVESRIGGGQLSIVVEVANTPDGDLAFTSIREGTRGGWSPGYYVRTARLLNPKDRDFDANEPFKMEVTSSIVFEASLTAIPANEFTRTLSIHEGETASMKNDIVIDMVDLSYKTAKAVLAGESGSVDQRKRLSAYVQEYDRQITAGMGRFEAAMAARTIALA